MSFIEVNSATIEHLEFIEYTTILQIIATFIGDFDQHEICFHSRNDSQVIPSESFKCNPITIANGLRNITFKENEIFYGENYLFYIKTIGCKYGCSSLSERKPARTGKLE